jgi:hypothetical protein
MKFLKTIAVILNFSLLWWAPGWGWHKVDWSKPFLRWNEESLLLPLLIICLSINLIIIAKELMNDGEDPQEKKDSIFSLWLKVKKKNLEDQLKK